MHLGRNSEGIHTPKKIMCTYLTCMYIISTEAYLFSIYIFSNISAINAFLYGSIKSNPRGRYTLSILNVAGISKTLIMRRV